MPLRPPFRRRFVAGLVLMAGVAGVAASLPAAAKPGEGDLRDKQRQLAQVRSERARAAARIDVLRADNAQVEDALAALEENVKERSTALGNARRKEDEATRAATEAEAAVQAKTTELAQTRASATQVALKAYMDPGPPGPLNLLGAADISAAAYRSGVLASQTRTLDDVVDRLGAVRQDLEIDQRKAAAAQAAATARRRDTEAELAALEDAQATQQDKATEVEAKLERTLAEAQALAATDAALSAEIQAQQSRVAARLAALQAQAEAGSAVRGPRVRANSAAPGSSAGSAPGTAGGSGSSSAPASGSSGGSGATANDPAPLAPLPAPVGGDQPPAPPAPPAVTATGEATAGTPDGNIRVVAVGGITVNASIAGQVQALLNAAGADGIVFGGGGYRSSRQQVALRAANCGGSSNYVIYQKPSSQCRPPTARPGQSNHERGLAIDFTCGGSIIRSRSSACYQWLAANAARFGLQNLPSEPWHWSVDGT